MGTRTLQPSPGRLIVKMDPIEKLTRVAGVDGKYIEKPLETIAREELLNNMGTVLAVGRPKTDGPHPWFQEGDHVVISRLGGTRMDLGDEEEYETFWLIPFEAVQGVWLEDVEEGH